MELKKIAINPNHLIIFMIIMIALAGYPYCLVVYKAYRFTYVTHAQQALLPKIYLWTLYAFSTFMILYYLLGAGKKIAAYQARETLAGAKRAYTLVWLGLFIATLICVAVLFCQNNFSHPMLSSIGLDKQAFAIKRIATSKAISPAVYSLGLKIFAAFSLFMAVFVLKKFWISIITILLTFILATFSLQKSPLAQMLLELLFIYLLLGKPKLRSVLILSGFMTGSLAVLYLLAKTIGNFGTFIPTIIRRAVFYQFSDLPYYFDLLSRQRLDFMALLSPQVQALFGQSAPASSRL
ncbi:MAG: hypothetical protein WC354_07960, partial [Candidatus Omnitrophota bacterium]